MQCSVCLDKLGAEDCADVFVPCTLVPCSHTICLGCATQLAKEECPECKTKIDMILPLSHLEGVKNEGVEAAKAYRASLDVVKQEVKASSSFGAGHLSGNHTGLGYRAVWRGNGSMFPPRTPLCIHCDRYHDDPEHCVTLYAISLDAPSRNRSISTYEHSGKKNRRGFYEATIELRLDASMDDFARGIKEPKFKVTQGCNWFEKSFHSETRSMWHCQGRIEIVALNNTFPCEIGLIPNPDLKGLTGVNGVGIVANSDLDSTLRPYINAFGINGISKDFKTRMNIVRLYEVFEFNLTAFGFSSWERESCVVTDREYNKKYSYSIKMKIEFLPI
jgi:hypothetical protein